MIDWTRVNALRDDIGADEFAEVVEIFLEEVEDVTGKLRTAPNTAELEYDLHALKNGALNLGFTQLSALCQVGETQAAIGKAVDVDVAAIITVFDASRAEFLSELPHKFD